MTSGLIGSRPARALHKHAGDDLKTVGDPMMKFLQQKCFLLQQIAFQFLGGADIGDVRDRQENANGAPIPIVQFVGVDSQTALSPPFAIKV
jgi:hypothetical protein